MELIVRFIPSIKPTYGFIETETHKRAFLHINKLIDGNFDQIEKFPHYAEIKQSNKGFEAVCCGGFNAMCRRGYGTEEQRAQTAAIDAAKAERKAAEEAAEEAKRAARAAEYAARLAKEQEELAIIQSKRDEAFKKIADLDLSVEFIYINEDEFEKNKQFYHPKYIGCYYDQYDEYYICEIKYNNKIFLKGILSDHYGWQSMDGDFDNFTGTIYKIIEMFKARNLEFDELEVLYENF